MYVYCLIVNSSSPCWSNNVRHCCVSNDVARLSPRNRASRHGHSTRPEVAVCSVGRPSTHLEPPPPPPCLYLPLLPVLPDLPPAPSLARRSRLLLPGASTRSRSSTMPMTYVFPLSKLELSGYRC